MHNNISALTSMLLLLLLSLLLLLFKNVKAIDDVWDYNYIVV